MAIGILLWTTGAFAFSDREKARYYFLQGSLEISSKNMAQAYEYFKKAYTLDPSYADAAFTYGNQRLFIQTDTLQSDEELNRSLALMRQYVDNNPLDLYAAQMYGYVTTALDTVEEAIRVYETTYELMPAETDLLQMLADSYMRLMKSKEAINALERYEAIEGKSKDTSLKKITFMIASKDTLGAVEEVESLISYNPRDPYSYVLKGNLYELLGNLDSVSSAYKAAERLAPDNGAVKMGLAQYYRAVGDSVMLDNMIYEALLSEDFELEDKIGILGDYLQKLLDEKGDQTRGDHLFAVLQAQYPHEPDLLEMAARYAGAKGNFNEASEIITYAIDLDPTNEMYWLMLISYRLTDDKYAEAVKVYKDAKKHFEPSIRLKNLYTGAVSMLNDAREAEKLLEEMLVEINPEFAEKPLTEEKLKEIRPQLDYDNLQLVSSIYCILGDLYYKGKDADNSFKNYEISLLFLPDNPLTLNNFAYFLSEEDRELEKAREMSARVLELVDNNATYLDTYAWILYKMGEYDEAMEYMKKAIELAKQANDDNEEFQKHFDAIQSALDAQNPHN